MLHALSLLALLSGPENGPNVFLDNLAQAQAKSQAREWAAALPLWQYVVGANPNAGFFWYSLGTAQYNTEHYREAAASFEKALELGVGRRANVAFEIARSHAMLKEKDATLNALQRAFDLGFRSRDRVRDEAAFAFLKDDPRFKPFAGIVDTKAMSRDEGWRSDVSFVAAEIKRMHYRPFWQTSEAKFDREVRKLVADVPKLTDNEAVVRIMRLMALAGDGHTGLFPDLAPNWNAAPVLLHLFDDGVYVVAADPQYADIVGKRVIRVGNEATADVIRKLDPIISKDSPQAVMRSAGSYMRFPQVLNGLGIQSQDAKLELTLEEGATSRKVTIPTAPAPDDFNRLFGTQKWRSVLEMTPEALPLYLKDRRTNFWFEELPNKTLYFQFNLVVNAPNETLSAFFDRLFKTIDERRIEKLIIDMRWNNGGNAFLLQPLIDGLICRPQINRNGRLFALVGRYTFSAAIVAASQIESRTNAMLVGEPTPTGPNFIGESNLVTLPYSKFRVSISDVYHQTTWSTDSRSWISPTLYVPVTFEAFRAKRDPALETILATSER